MPQDQHNLVDLVRPAHPFDTETPIDLSGLDGKTILITGGASGFGEGFFRKWAENGANAIIADINSTKGKALVAEVRKSTKNPNLHFLYCDVTDWQSQVDMFRAAVKLSTHGGIDAVVANAGVVEDNPTFDSPPDNLGTLEEPPRVDLKALEVNLIGTMYTAHLAFHYLPKNPGSEKTYLSSVPGQNSSNRDRHLLLIGSMAGIYPMPKQVQYSASKHAIVGVYRSLSCTAFTKGIRINLLMPYFTDTPMLSTIARVVLAGGPMGKIEDVVDAGTRLMGNNNIGGKALVIGPKVKVSEDWNVVSQSSDDGKVVTSWEVYGQDFDDVDIFTWRFVKMMNQTTKFNGWVVWASDTVAALLYPLQRLLRK